MEIILVHHQKFNNTTADGKQILRDNGDRRLSVEVPSRPPNSLAYLQKIIMLGSSKVGKTALGVKFVQRTFVLEYDPTIEDTLRKTIEIDGTNITFDIFDTSGDEEYKAIQDQYIRAGDGFLLVYSVTDKESFEKCEETYQRILRIKDVDSVPVVLVGNNIDSAGRVVSLAEGEELAKQNGWGFFETSAKDNINVDNAFIAISRRVSNNRHRMDARPVKKK